MGAGRQALPAIAARPERLSADRLSALSTWVLAGSLVLYLGFSHGGYPLSTYGVVGIVVWWCAVLATSWALLPAAAPSRLALGALGVFGGFTLWTALGITWSISSGRSFADLGLVTTYFGIVVLAVAIHRERATAVRHTLGAAASALSILAACSVATRLWPDFIPSATAINHAGGRLSWPLDYWNALAAMTAMAIPLLLAIATTARRLVLGAAAAAAIPVVALCGALTQSRGGVVEVAAALLVWLLLPSQRIAKLMTALLCAGASAVIIGAAFEDRAVRTAETGGLERHQADHLVIIIVLVCLVLACLQAGFGLLLRRWGPRSGRLPSLSRRRAALAWAVGLILCVIVAVAAGVPHHLSHAWTDFKNSSSGNATTTHLSADTGEGRYQYWVAGIQSASHHPFTGSGPGTFQQDWLPRAHIRSYVLNAHSLYVETYTELGLVGIGLLGAFIVLCLLAALRATARARGPARTQAAAIAAALVAFFLGASFDWLWQMPVLVAAALVLAAAGLAPERHLPSPEASPSAAPEARARRRHLSARPVRLLATTLVGLAALAAIAYPLDVNAVITDSQTAVNAGDLPQALADARHAVSLEPDSGAAQIQLSLVLEQQRHFREALTAARSAVRHEPDNWSNWLTLSRIAAENGQAQASVAAYERARQLNPESTVFG